MLENKQNITKYLQDYKEGKISKGLDTGLLRLDEALRFKQSQLTIINGLDNVGKTIWMLWYFLCLSVKHNLKWCIYSGENKSGQLVRQLIQFYTGKYLKDLTIQEIFKYELMISDWFEFVSNDNFYKSKDLFDVFSKGNYKGCLIDPYTGMNREYTHAANYDFLNESRHFCNSTGKSLYVNTHVVSEAARRNYPEGHQYSGYPSPPTKSQSEGGQPFGNRTDDFITIHRMVGHPTEKYNTEIYIRKIKDTETGGEVSAIDDPLRFDFNKGLGFTLNGQNILSNKVEDSFALSDLSMNENFDNEKEVPF